MYATTINVDIDSRDDGPHVGDNGVFSSVGATTWNRISLSFSSDVNLVNVLDEFGVATDVDLTFDANGSADFNGRGIELYDGGGTGILDIKTLPASSRYDLAIYSHGTFGGNLSVTVSDLIGMTTKMTSGTFTVELPGDEDEEYVIFNGLKPFDLAGGVMGLRIETNGTTPMAGFQLRENAVVPEPSTVAVFALGSLVLLAPTCRKRFFQRSRVIVRLSTKGDC